MFQIKWVSPLSKFFSFSELTLFSQSHTKISKSTGEILDINSLVSSKFQYLVTAKSFEEEFLNLVIRGWFNFIGFLVSFIVIAFILSFLQWTTIESF
jgi:hypothetical protein